MRTPVRTLLLLGAVAGAAIPAGAEEIAGLTVHGFISQGYIRTTENELYFGHTTDGNFEFNEAALSFSTEPIPRLRVGMQLFAQDLGSLGNHRVIVDWAVGDYRLNDAFGVRGGKLKLPLGLYGTLRDADLGRPEILQPEAIYSDNLKDLVRAFNGASVYGTFELGGAATSTTRRSAERSAPTTPRSASASRTSRWRRSRRPSRRRACARSARRPSRSTRP